jgi:hypothetical protein
MDNKKEKRGRLAISLGILLLIVLLFGASFSYYLVTGNNTTTTTSGRVTLEKSGTVNLVQGISNIYLDVTAAQMAVELAGTDYYGTASEGNPETTPQNHVLATIQATGGDQDTIYECSMEYNITATQIIGSSNDAFAALEKKDADIIINAVPEDNSGNIATNIIKPRGLVVQTLFNQAGQGSQGAHLGYVPISETDVSTIIINGNTSLDITGDLVMHNLDEDQTDLAELGVNVSFQITSFSCNPVDIALEDNNVLALEKNNQINMAIGNNISGVANTNGKVIIDDLTNKYNQTEIKKVLKPQTSVADYYSYYATPNGRSDSIAEITVATIVNNSDNNMVCSISYGIEVLGNMLSVVQEVNSINLDLAFLGTIYDKNNIPSQITKAINISPRDIVSIDTGLNIHSSEDNISSLYDTSIRVNYTPVSLDCAIFDSEHIGNKDEFGEFDPFHGGGTILPYDPVIPDN